MSRPVLRPASFAVLVALLVASGCASGLAIYQIFKWANEIGGFRW